MQAVSETNRRGNPDRLRAEIDHGRTGDKVRVSDPAAAPLGTDDEAAGTPMSHERVEQARRHELAAGEDARSQHETEGFPKAWLWLVAFGVVLIGSVWAIRL